ncbi:MAG: hypothetical protein RLZZ69_1672 [Cyanobacteriota bacterium]
MKIALVHDYLIEAGGAERVLKVLSEMYPQAPIYTALSKNGTAKAMFRDRKIEFGFSFSVSDIDFIVAELGLTE